MVKTKLGQHFLNDEAIIEKELSVASLNQDDIVLEIGPGKGVLTKRLAQKCSQVIAVELDDKLIPFLNSYDIGSDNDKERRTLITITSDIINELKYKIPNISSLNEIGRIIDGFQYGQKKVGGRNVRTAFGTNIQLLDFLGME